MRPARLLAAAACVLCGACDAPACAADEDCDGDRVCDVDGACVDDPRPRVTWRAPTEGAAVGDVFDVVVDVTFQDREAVVELSRDPGDPGLACAPFLGETRAVPGDPGARRTQTVAFRGVRATGGGYLVEARAATGVYATTRRFDAAPDAAQDLRIAAPAAGVHDADGATFLPLSVELATAADVVTAWVEPEAGPPSPRVVVGLATDAVLAHVPFARGRQIVRVEADRGGTVSRCAVGVVAAPTQAPGIEVGLMFESVEASAADLWIFDASGRGCSASSLGGACASVFRSPRPAQVGGEALLLPPEDGLYGVAVAPGAAGPPLTARLRASVGDAHVAFFGPRTVDPARGEVWRAARVVVSGGQATFEELFAVEVGLPTEPPAEW